MFGRYIHVSLVHIPSCDIPVPSDEQALIHGWMDTLVMADELTEPFEYTPEEAVEVIRRAVDRKKDEIAALTKKMARLKKEESIQQNQELMDYLEADLVAYLAVLADMTDDESILDDVEVDSRRIVECPTKYDCYLDGLSADDLENELEADDIRADYCDGIIQDMCTDIGERALSTKKMVKALLEDPYALTQIGELIFYDDYLYDTYTAIMEAKAEKKKKKK